MDSIMHVTEEQSTYAGRRQPESSTYETVDKGMHYIYPGRQVVFKEAVKGMADVSVEIMKKIT
jgi:3-oxoacyl-[acyl-carrier-protein] synthase-3